MVEHRYQDTASQPVLSYVAHDAEHAARIALAASMAAGNPLSQRQVMTQFGVSWAAERTMRHTVAAGSSGHAQLGAEHIQEDN